MRPPPIAFAYLTLISLCWAAAAVEKLTVSAYSQMTCDMWKAVLPPDEAR